MGLFGILMKIIILRGLNENDDYILIKISDEIIEIFSLRNWEAL